MCHRAHRRYVVTASGLHVGRRQSSTHEGPHRGGDSGFQSVRAAEAEVDDGPLPRGQSDAGSLGCDQRRVLDEIYRRRLHELPEWKRSRHLEDRFIGQNDRAIGNGPDLSLRLELCQFAHCRLVETDRAQIVELLAVIAKPVEEIERAIGAVGDEPRSLGRGSDVQAEGGRDRSCLV